ncbi:hypothetical protein FPSE_05269 [Fusarium pseudograminearum CS3096]|uniref:Uncharacterized protein n=1 Tax=Fusarium pseudograminearum (strain CS3096) TaxID=1028729 RepID=K3VJB1_FUSPC|nr:hypothetical protein FPSE_05269 [Fusarium pseudograminearum CS3096]EKJ74519.1 hypothetical protein FPSE_05269 [Fusarium pseudograminearum CS3096]KAF0635799.1 hypothetical protein FPSE5266_05269 [Fusarium pseudograminearum]
MEDTKTGRKNRRWTRKRGKKAKTPSNKTTTECSRSNTDSVKPANASHEMGAGTPDHTTVSRKVRAKDPNRAQYWDANTVFAPSAIRQQLWKLQQHYAPQETDAAAGASNSVNRC